MPLLTPRLNYDQARALVDANFTDIRFPDVALGHDTEDKRVKLFIVHGRRHVEPIRFRNWGKSAAPAKVSLFQQDTYDRFVLFGIPESSKTCALFTKSPQASAVLFRYCARLPPATPSFYYMLT